MSKKIITLLLLALGVTAQSFANTSDLPGYTSQTNIDYVGDNHTGHKFDIYYPNDNKPTHPVIIHIYGSGWAANNQKGDAALNTIGVAALEAGYIFVAPNHRASTDALFPAQINDIKALVRYLRGNAQSLGIDDSFIAVSGFSSGGHLAALMGVTKGVSNYTVGSVTMNIEGDLGTFTKQSSSVNAVCSWSGLTEIISQSGCDIPSILTSYIENLMGGSYESNPDKWALACASTYVDETDAPAILFHGSADSFHPQCVSENLYYTLQAAHVDCEYYAHNGAHEIPTDYIDEMITFFNRIKVSTSLNQTNQQSKINNQKLIKDGQLFILRDGKTYNALGFPVR